MNFSNGLTPGQIERLGILAEECGEVIQEVGKILRHGFDSVHPDGGPTNRQKLITECGHIGAAIELLISKGDMTEDELDASFQAKLNSRGKYLHHQ